MPLRALVDGKELISIYLSDQEWVILKKEVQKKNLSVKLPCCGQNGFLRVSSKGLKHFVHGKEGTPCDWESETPQHLKSKVEIAKACRDNGWLAIPEYSENDWRADILATKGDARIAFEVQWSTQTEDDTNFRQERYRQSNVRGCWFFRTPPKQLRDYDKAPKAIKELPIFKILEDESKNIVLHSEGHPKDLYSFVGALLNGKIKYRPGHSANPEQEAKISFFKTECHKCHAPQHLYFTEVPAKSCCGKSMDLAPGDIDLNPQIISAVKEILKSEAGKHLRLGEIRNRYSRAAGHEYLSFGCYFCDALFGQVHLFPEKIAARGLPDNITFTRKVTLQISDPIPHWCYSETGIFCAPPSDL